MSISEFKTINESGFVVVKIMMVGSTHAIEERFQVCQDP